jgi:hypothetical protein
VIHRCLSAVFLLIGLSFIGPAQAQNPAQVIETITTGGEKVRLHPNGRWEYINAQKAAAAKVVADQYPENRQRPLDAQGCLFGIGRCIMPGDKDYNRGTLNPAKR